MTEFGIKYIDTYNEDYFPAISSNSNFHDCNGHFIVSAKQEYTKNVVKFLQENKN